ncbi:nitrous oxide reductase family maturation protein NosD [Candidatus Poribacteria bacterium]|nr:nitrous oxide reductase family maturation protein NosD [Candidatus Poribacteria bacterium]
MQDRKMHQNWLAKTLLIAAGTLLLTSLFFPYWHVELETGIYPKGLELQIRPYRVEGDVEEIDKLNHYIGMRTLASAGQLERTIAVPSIIIAALCLLIAPFVPKKWALWLTVPGLVFPVIFLGELYWWLRDSGLHLDPNAPLNQTIKPFIPPLFGDSVIAQFSAKASFQTGFFLALLSGAFARVAFYFMKPEWLAKSLIVDAALLLIVSLLFPYWRVDFETKKFPRPLILQVRPHRLEGNIGQIDKLHQDLGMRELETAGQFERKVALPSIAIVAFCLLVSAVLPKKWGFWCALPSLGFPLIFVGVLYWWIRDSGMNLDPEMALYPDTEPFAPPLVGTKKVGNLTTIASFQIGFYFAVAAALIVGTSLYFQRLKRFNLQKLTLIMFLSVFTLWITSSGIASTRIVEPDVSIAETLQSAADGDTLIVKGGHYQERFIIDKSITLKGENDPVIDGSGSGSVITVTAPGVAILGFTIQNTGIRLSEGDAGIMVKRAKETIIKSNHFKEVLFGVQVRNSPDTVVKNNTFEGKDLDVGRRGDLIRVWYSDGSRVENNRVFDGRDVVVWYSKKVVVNRNEVRNGRYGIHFMYCDDANIQENRLIGNSVGVYLMYSYRLQLAKNWAVDNRGASGYGIGLKDMHDGQITDNLVADNRAGMFMDNATNTFNNNLIAFNDSGILVLPSARKNEFIRNSFIDNGEQVTIEGQGSIGNNQWDGNYWSDYSGYDADHDGVGDVPYRSMRLFERLTERYPALRIFTYSPSVNALDFATHLFPIFTPQPKLTDKVPLMRPTALTLETPQKRVSVAWLIGSTALCLPGLTFFGLNEWASRSRNNRQRETLKTDPTPDHTGQTSHISIRNLTKRYGTVTAVDTVSFDVTAGETVALWGINGAGKTTVLRCILGILPFDGTITVANNNEAAVEFSGSNVSPAVGKAIRRQIGYVPQEVRLQSDLTVKETVLFYARFRSVPQMEIEELMEEWLLFSIADKQISALSGGMKQRLSLAIAMLSDPPILLLDEPTSNLDSQTQREFWGTLERLSTAGKTLIFCSHRLDEIMGIADRVIVMNAGRKVAEGPPTALDDYLSTDILLHLRIPEKFQDKAATLLTEKGFSVRHSRLDVSVRTAHKKKMEPFHILMAASIPIDDFELSDSEKRGEA